MFKYQQEDDIPLFYDPFSPVPSQTSLTKPRRAPLKRQRSRPRGDLESELRKIRIEQVIEDIIRLTRK